MFIMASTKVSGGRRSVEEPQLPGILEGPYSDQRRYPDGRLVDLAKGGDGKAFTALYRRHMKAVDRVIEWGKVPESERDDIMQEIAVRAFKYLDTYRGESGLDEWISSIAKNRVLDEANKAARRQARMGHAGVGGAEGSPYDSTYEEFARRMRISDVKSAMAGLDDNFRRPLEMRELDGRDYREIADTLGVGINTVRTRIHRARKKIKDSLGEKGYG
jgi:RNA polymerase sigma-70 factor, ECF subfamily